MTQAVFPKSIFPWTDRVDEVNVIWANDPNSLAAEVVAVENTLGAMPQVEKSPFSGPSVTYNSVDARLSDLLAGNQMPYCSVSLTQAYVYNNQSWGTYFGQINTFSKIYDPFGFYNGTDITVPASGLYLIAGSQQWSWHDSGYFNHGLFINGVWYTGYRWVWPQNTGYGPSYYNPERNAQTSWTHMGPLAAGTRLQVVSENGTSQNPCTISNSWMRVYCLRKLPANALDS